MAKQKSTFEWEMWSEANWDRRKSADDLVDDAVVPVAQHRRLPLSHLWTATLVALLVIGSGAYMVWRQAQAGLERINAEIALAVEAEVWRAKSESHAQSKATGESVNSLLPSTLEECPALADWDNIKSKNYETVPRPDLSTPAKVKIDKVEIGEMALGLAMVEVTKVDTAGNAYRETQFYRDEESIGWQRTSPDASFWGPEQSAETAHFRWYYRARDAAVVAEVMHPIDRLYVQLRHDVGLPPPFPTEKLMIEVRAAALNSSVAEFADNRLVTLSPLLVVAPAEISQVEVLHTSVLFRLVQHTLHLAQEQQPVWCIWRPLLGGLMQWQVRTYGGSPLLGEGIPVQSATSLKKLLERDEDCLDRPVTQLASGLSDLANTAMAETLFAYVIETYGRDALPTLLAAFRRHSTWEDAIPFAFTTSKDAFEADWQAYVSRQRSRL